MALIKHSVRTLRRPCSQCGSSDLYWAHDTEGGPSKSGHYCKEHDAVNWTRINRDGSKHDCKGDDDQPNKADVAQDEEMRFTPPPVITEPAPVPAAAPSASSDPAMAAFQAFMAAVAPKVDATQVHQIVDDRLRGLVLPTRVQLVEPNGDVRDIDGVSHKAFPTVLNMVLAGRKAGRPLHVYMHGPGGTGKTSIAPQVAEAVGLPYYPISLGPTMTESKLMGYMDAAGNYHWTAWTKAIKDGGIVLLDECDSANAAVLTVADAALANGHVGLPNGETIEVSKDFIVLAAGNTTGNGADRMYVGRQSQDKAFLDRFTFVHVDYDNALEETMCMATGIDSGTMAKVLAYVRAVRSNILANSMPVLCGMRAAIDSCTLLAGGVPFAAVRDGRIRHGMSDADWRKVSEDVPMPRI